MVKQLIDGIQVLNQLIITLAKTKVKDDKLGNWLGAVSYMATKITESFGVAMSNKNKESEGKYVRISAVEVHRKDPGGRGRCSGCYRGRFCGRSNDLFSNGVDCQ